MTTRELIELRARQIYKIAEHQLLHYDPTDFTVGTAFRYAYLIVRRSPRAFLKAFENGDLRISPDEVAEFIFQNSENVEPPHHLLPEELATITTHNREVGRASGGRPEISSEPNLIRMQRRPANCSVGYDYE